MAAAVTICQASDQTRLQLIPLILFIRASPCPFTAALKRIVAVHLRLRLRLWLKMVSPLAAFQLRDLG